MEAPSLSAQTRRLRFDDPAQEKRFQAHDDARSLRQWRIATVLGGAVVILLGLSPISGWQPWQVQVEMIGRFGLMLPWFFLAFGWSWWSAQRHRMQLIGVICVTSTVTMYFLTQAVLQSARPLSAGAIVGMMATSSQYLIAVAVAVPLRTRALAVAIGPTVAFYFVALALVYPGFWEKPVLLGNALNSAAVSVGIGIVVIAVTWARERLLRTSFAQQEQLEAMNAELARLNAEKNEFMAIAAHDLRAPLALVGGVAEQMKHVASAGKLADGAALIEAQTGRMLSLVNDYLGAHAAESGTLPVRLERIDLGLVAREAAARHAAVAGAKQQTFELGGDRVATWTEADAALLAQVVDNLVTNAIKFSPRGAAVRLEVQTADGHPRARLAVIDRGPGIAADEQANLFRKFGRASTRPTGGESSHGLGLAVAKRLAEAMGGGVGCESEPGAGATFWVELPRVS